MRVRTFAAIMTALLFASGCEIYFGTPSSDTHRPDARDRSDAQPAPDARQPIDARAWDPPPDADGPWLFPDASEHPDAGAACAPAAASSCTCPDGSQSTSVPRFDDDSCLCGTPFQRMRDGMVGRWRGVSGSPWTSHPPGTPVAFELRNDGSYSADCPGDCVALYYGSDADHPTKKWELQDIWANGTGFGRIAVHFPWTGIQWGEISSVALNADATRLHFEFYNVWGGRYGPVIYDLTRCAD